MYCSATEFSVNLIKKSLTICLWINGLIFSYGKVRAVFPGKMFKILHFTSVYLKSCESTAEIKFFT